MLVSKNLILLFVLLTTLVGCASIDSPEYLSSTRTIPPQPVYNRVFIARPPEVLPNSPILRNLRDSVDPVYQLEAANETVENVAKQLATAARYRSYTAASVADRKISIESLGTIDELADTISRTADVYVSVDKANRELRVLPPKRSQN